MTALPMRFTDREKAREAQAEYHMRRKVYLGMVNRGRMTPHEAERRMAIMQEIQRDYECLAALKENKEGQP